MSELKFLNELKQLKIQIEQASETVRELATRTVVEQEDEIKQDCFLNMFGDLNNKVESIELMIEQIESQTYSLEDRML